MSWVFVGQTDPGRNAGPFPLSADPLLLMRGCLQKI